MLSVQLQVRNYSTKIKIAAAVVATQLSEIQSTFMMIIIVTELAHGAQNIDITMNIFTSKFSVDAWTTADFAGILHFCSQRRPTSMKPRIVRRVACDISAHNPYFPAQKFEF